MRHSLLTVSVLAGLFTWCIPAIASIELPEACHMGECWVRTLQSKELLRSNEIGELYFASFSTVRYPAPDSADAFRQMFVEHYGSELVEQQSQSYIFCSSSIPSTLSVTDNNGLILNRLSINGTPPAAYIRHEHINYLATCHNIAGPDFFSNNVANILIREGYNFDLLVDTQMRVSNILEIMNPNATEY